MVALPVSIDRTSPVPLYHQLAEQLTAAITDGELRPGDPFENEIAMSGRLGLSRPTVRRAISELVGQGLLIRRRGIGTTVANQMVHRKAELTSHGQWRSNSLSRRVSPLAATSKAPVRIGDDAPRIDAEGGRDGTRRDASVVVMPRAQVAFDGDARRFRIDGLERALA